MESCAAVRDKAPCRVSVVSSPTRQDLGQARLRAAIADIAGPPGDAVVERGRVQGCDHVAGLSRQHGEAELRPGDRHVGVPQHQSVLIFVAAFVEIHLHEAAGFDGLGSGTRQAQAEAGLSHRQIELIVVIRRAGLDPTREVPDVDVGIVERAVQFDRAVRRERDVRQADFRLRRRAREQDQANEK